MWFIGYRKNNAENCSSESINTVPTSRRGSSFMAYPGTVYRHTAGDCMRCNRGPKKTEKSTLIVTCDVESLYSNIRHTDGLAAMKYFLQKQEQRDEMHDSFLSFHPEHLRKGIPKGQFLRVRRNCTNDSDFKEEAADLTRRFQARGYPRKTISKAYITAKNTPRKDLLTPKPRKTNTETRFRGARFWRKTDTRMNLIYGCTGHRNARRLEGKKSSHGCINF